MFFLCAAIDPADAALNRAFFRHAAQKCSTIHKVSSALFELPDEKIPRFMSRAAESKAVPERGTGRRASA